MSRLRTALLTAVCLAGLLAGAMPASAETLARSGQGFSHISTYRDSAAWVQGTGVWAYVGGKVTQIRRPSPGWVPSVDLGPAVDGSLVAVYDFCRPRHRRGQRQAVDDCDLFRYDFRTRRTTPIRAANTVTRDERSPSIWRDKIVFTRVRQSPVLERSYWLDGAGRLHRLRHVGSGFDLRGTRVIYEGRSTADRCYDDEQKVDGFGPVVVSIAIQSLLTGARRVLDSTCTASYVPRLRSPQLTSTDAYWQADVFTPCNRTTNPRCNGIATAPHILHLVGGKVQDIAIGDNQVFEYGISDTSIFWVSVDNPPADISLNRVPAPRAGDAPVALGPGPEITRPRAR